MKIEEAKEAIMSKSKAMTTINAINNFGHIPCKEGIYIDDVLNIINKLELDKPKPVVPKGLFEALKEYKERGDILFTFINDAECFEGVEDWLRKGGSKAEDTLAEAWLAYPNITVEKEKLYTVEIPNPNIIGKERTVLMKNGFNQIVMLRGLNDNWRTVKGYQLTESEIRKDFDWAWQWKKEVTE